MTHIKILRYLLLLLVTSTADLFQNESDTSLNRTRRLTDASYNEECLRLAKYTVSIRTRHEHKFYGDNHFCSGVIVSPIFVITSSHCVINSQRVVYSSRLLIVVAGTPNRLRYQAGKSFHSPVKRITVSDNFLLRNEEDIGVLELKIPLPRHNDYIAIAKLPYQKPEIGILCSVMGWGRSFEDGPLQAKIVYMNTHILHPKKCAQMLGIIKSDLLCTLAYESDVVTRHPCDGDLGAPLIHGSTIYGIVGYIFECNDAELPNVYTDVYKNLIWIRIALTFNRSSICCDSLLLVYGVVFVHFIRQP